MPVGLECEGKRFLVKGKRVVLIEDSSSSVTTRASIVARGISPREHRRVSESGGPMVQCIHLVTLRAVQTASQGQRVDRWPRKATKTGAPEAERNRGGEQEGQDYLTSLFIRVEESLARTPLGFGAPGNSQRGKSPDNCIHGTQGRTGNTL